MDSCQIYSEVSGVFKRHAQPVNVNDNQQRDLTWCVDSMNGPLWIPNTAIFDIVTILPQSIAEILSIITNNCLKVYWTRNHIQQRVAALTTTLAADILEVCDSHLFSKSSVYGHRIIQDCIQIEFANYIVDCGINNWNSYNVIRKGK
jgi:hypothetical protein